MRRVALLALISLVAVASAGVPPARTIAWVISLRGGLDHAAQVRELEDQLREAKSGGARLVCVELSGRAWRIDVADALGAVLERSEPPAIALVKSEDGDIGLGPLIAASRASSGCWVEPGRPLTIAPNDNARDLASDARELKKQESAWVKGDEKSPLATYDALRSAIIDPKAGCWMSVSKGGGVMVYPGEPTSQERLQAERVAVFCGKGASRLSIDVADAVALRVCRGSAAGAQAAIEAALEGSGGVRPEIRETRSVGAPLAERSAAVHRLVDESEGFLARAELELKAKDPDTGLAMKRAKAMVRTAREKLERASALIREVPEILRTMAPGEIDAGQTPSEHESRWKRTLQRLSDRAAKIEAKIDAKH